MILNLKNKNIVNYIIYFFPILLITGPALPDLSLTIISIFFLYSVIKNNQFYLLNETWFKIGIILWIWFLFISFFAQNKYLSFIDASIFIRYLIYILAIQNFIILNEKIRNKIFKFIFLTLIFIALDSLYQFLNYKPEIGFYKDLLGRTPDGLYARLSGPFKDLVPGSVITKFFFISLLYILIIEKKIKFILMIIILPLSINMVYFSGERVALLTLGLGLIPTILFLKEFRKMLIISSIMSIFMVIFFTNLHPIYKNYKIIESSSKHEGLIIEKKIDCVDLTKKNCTKTFFVQPDLITILKDFKNSAYGEIYLTAIKMWQDNKIFGIGLNNYKFVCDNEKKYKKFHPNYGCASHPHNFFIQALVESGFIGLSIFMILVLSFFVTIKKSNQNIIYKILFAITLLTIFWPIMSTGSFLKNWHMCIISFILGICLSDYNRNKIKNLKYLN